MDLVKQSREIKELPDIFSKHGFNRQFSSDIIGNFEILYEKARELNFELPNYREKFFTIFHNLGSGDFDAAYLYDVNSTPIALNGNPKLENIVGLAENLTSAIHGNNLVIFYENERFAIPKISLYRDGQLMSKSVDSGNEIYKEDYWKDDERKINERGKKTLGILFAVLREVARP